MVDIFKGDGKIEELNGQIELLIMIVSMSVITSYISVTLWALSAARLGAEIRKKIFRSLLSQPLAWHESHSVDEIIFIFDT
jgi:ABC-type bacteriocin/lantibiotic exporter with double-glycine peptidase domain